MFDYLLGISRRVIGVQLSNFIMAVSCKRLEDELGKNFYQCLWNAILLYIEKLY